MEEKSPTPSTSRRNDDDVTGIPADPASVKTLMANLGMPEEPSRHVAKKKEWQRARQGLILRMAGFTFDDIAERLGYSNGGAAGRAVKRIMRRRIMESADDIRALDLLRTEDWILKLTNKINRGDTRAVEVGVRVLERRSKMIGYDAVDQQQGNTQAVQVNVEIVPHELDGEAQRIILEQSVESLQAGTPKVLLPPAQSPLLEETNDSSDRGVG